MEDSHGIGEETGLLGLLAAVDTIRTAVAAEGRRRFRRWRPCIRRRRFAASSLNLAHYLALRHRDIRPLQRGLMRFGLSSLGRLESRVLASLDSVAAALRGLSSDHGGRHLAFPSPRQFFRGERQLEANAAELFGPPVDGRPGRILVTLSSDAATDARTVLALAKRGADAVRINCAHDDPSSWMAMIEHVRSAERSVGRRLKILMDIAGPKCRTAEVLAPSDRNHLLPGDRLLLSRTCLRSPAASPFQATLTLPQVLDRLRAGERVFVDDGHFGGIVEATTDDGVVLRIDFARLDGGKLKPQKGLNFPDTDLGLSPLTEKDLADLNFVAAHADLIGYSFVESAADVRLLQDELAARRPDWTAIGLVAKIETPRAVRNLPELIVQAAARQPFAVMIARGDLAIEIGYERLAEMQEEMLWLCEAAHVPVIWATQVLESLVKTGMPSRGEMTDAAMAARAECVMLNKGPHVAAAIDVLDRLLRRMAEHQFKKTPRLRALQSW
jgi:pyruvate kinase